MWALILLAIKGLFPSASLQEPSPVIQNAFPRAHSEQPYPVIQDAPSSVPLEQPFPEIHVQTCPEFQQKGPISCSLRWDRVDGWQDQACILQIDPQHPAVAITALI